MPEPCTCLPRSPDDQCPIHGYEQWLRSKESPVLTPKERDTLNGHVLNDYEDSDWDVGGVG